MKKFTLIAAGTLVAMAAQAQYTCDPSTETIINAGAKTVDYIVLSDDAINDLKNAGATLNYCGPSPDEGRNLWYWNGFNPGDESFPRVDMAEGGYVSVEIAAGATWSGAGFAVAAPGLNLSHFNDNTRFHLAYMSPSGNGPASIALIVLDKAENQSNPAKIALGTAYNDNGAIYPAVGPAINDDWQGIDISFADLKKLYPSFSPAHLDGWEGNILSWLAGSVAGQTLAFDAVYFYTTETTGIEAVDVVSDIDFVVTGNTVNVNGAYGMVLYNLTGKAVKSTDGTVLGVNDLTPGVYVVKAGNKARKIVVR